VKWLLTIAAAVAGVVVAKKFLSPSSSTSPSAKPPASPVTSALPSPSTSSTTTVMRVVAPSGLHVRSAPSTTDGEVLDTVPFGREVQVVTLRSDGWAEIASETSDHTAFVCNTCSDAPGGPWLVPVTGEVAA